MAGRQQNTTRKRAATTDVIPGPQISQSQQMAIVDHFDNRHHGIFDLMFYGPRKLTVGVMKWFQMLNTNHLTVWHRDDYKMLIRVRWQIHEASASSSHGPHPEAMAQDIYHIFDTMKRHALYPSDGETLPKELLNLRGVVRALRPEDKECIRTGELLVVPLSMYLGTSHMFTDFRSRAVMVRNVCYLEPLGVFSREDFSNVELLYIYCMKCGISHAMCCEAPKQQRVLLQRNNMVLPPPPTTIDVLDATPKPMYEDLVIMLYMDFHKDVFNSNPEVKSSLKIMLRQFHLMSQLRIDDTKKLIFVNDKDTNDANLDKPACFLVQLWKKSDNWTTISKLLDTDNETRPVHEVFGQVKRLGCVCVIPYEEHRVRKPIPQKSLYGMFQTQACAAFVKWIFPNKITFLKMTHGIIPRSSKSSGRRKMIFRMKSLDVSVSKSSNASSSTACFAIADMEKLHTRLQRLYDSNAPIRTPKAYHKLFQDDIDSRVKFLEERLRGEEARLRRPPGSNVFMHDPDYDDDYDAVE